MARRGLGGKSLVLAAADEQFDVHREFVIDFLIDGPEPPKVLRRNTMMSDDGELRPRLRPA